MQRYASSVTILGNRKVTFCVHMFQQNGHKQEMKELKLPSCIRFDDHKYPEYADIFIFLSGEEYKIWNVG